MRVYELAKQLGIPAKELAEKIKLLGIKIKSHMSSLDADTAELVRQELEEEKEKAIAQNVIEVDFPLTVRELAVKLGRRPSEIVQILMRQGKMFNLNQTLEKELAVKIAYDYGFTLREKPKLETVYATAEKDSSSLSPRPPVVTIMGHIDHGKTSLLDYIRKSNITESESGGITQHIGAYQIELEGGKKITFIDTPGHETFTAMRARGANITDIVILVVAADDGVKPQTVEAINHAQAAKVPIIVAINKIDKNPQGVDMVKQQLSKLGLQPEDWGGKTIMVPVSAKTGSGIKELLEMILLEAEMLELKANYQRPALGIVLESKVSSGLGVVTSVFVQEGILHRGDVVVCGLHYGRIRNMYDDRKRALKEASPSSAVEIIGLNGVVSAGDKFFVVPNEKTARKIIEERKAESKIRQPQSAGGNLSSLWGEKEQKEFRIIIKADTYGTLEAIESLIKSIKLEEVNIQVLHKGVGSVNNSDIALAEASQAFVVAFRVSIESKARELAKQKKIQIKRYQVIYEVTTDIKAALEGMLEPEVKVVNLGRAVVKKMFNLSKVGTVAGCIVEKGKVVRGAYCRVIRGEEIVANKSRIVSLKRFKDDVREVIQGIECGIVVSFSAVKEGDVLEVFEEEISARRINI